MCNCQRNLQIGTSLEECVPTFSNEFLTSWKLKFYGVSNLWNKGDHTCPKCYFFRPLERFEKYIFKMKSHSPFEYLKHKLWPK
jgi:hypothetical protein